MHRRGSTGGRAARAWMTIWLSVSVPVLSEQSSVMPAISSIAVSRVTIAPCAASWRLPSASVVVLRAAPQQRQRSGDMVAARSRVTASSGRRILPCKQLLVGWRQTVGMGSMPSLPASASTVACAGMTMPPWQGLHRCSSPPEIPALIEAALAATVFPGQPRGQGRPPPDDLDGDGDGRDKQHHHKPERVLEHLAARQQVDERDRAQQHRQHLHSRQSAVTHARPYRPRSMGHWMTTL